MRPHQNCLVTHRLILTGACPWCGQAIQDDSVPADGRMSDPPKRLWSLERMLETLESEAADVRGVVASNMLFHCPDDIELAMTIFQKLLTDRSRTIQFIATQALITLGQKLDVQKAEYYEAMASQSDSNQAVSILLLAYYSKSQLKHTINCRPLVKTIIQHWPTSPIGETPYLSLSNDDVGYHEAKQIWLEQADKHPDDSLILGNAATFFAIRDPSLSGDFLRRARSLAPTDPKWPKRLAALYERVGINSPAEARRDWSAMAHAELKRALALSESTSQRLPLLARLGHAAFEAGEIDQAELYAAELLDYSTTLENPFVREQQIHRATVILGRIALARGDVAAATASLLKSSQTAEPTTFIILEPDLSLARELLERNEVESVILFLERLADSWEPGANHLTQWISDLRSGVTPNLEWH